MDITMTATLRPEILERTLSSFKKYVFGEFEDHRLIINIDPIGGSGELKDMIKIVDDNFVHYEIICPKAPNFAKAFRTVWAYANNRYIFHLEDDWEALRPIDLDTIVDIMEMTPDLALLRFPLWDCGETCKQWNRYFPWNGVYYKCPENMKFGLGFSGNPSILRKQFVKEIFPLLHTKSCPEKQIKGNTPEMKTLLGKWEYGVFGSPGDTRAVKDIGRTWREEHDFKKNGSYGFTTWISKTI